VVEQQHPHGVRLQAADADPGLEVQHDPFIAEADAEILKAPVPAAGLGQDVVELIAVHGRGVTGRGPDAGFAARPAEVVVEHPLVRDRVAELHGAGCNRAPLEVVLLAVDALWLSGLVVPVLLPREHLDLHGESQEAAVEIASDPLPAPLGDTLRGLRRVVALVPTEQHDLGAAVPVSQQPRLLPPVEWSPEVAAPVRPALRLEAPAAVGWRSKQTSAPWPRYQERYSSPCGLREPAATFAPTPKLPPTADCAAAGGQLVDVLAQLVGRHAGAGVCDRQLAHPAAGGVEPLPVEIPDDPAARVVTERGDRVKPVDSQLAPALNVDAVAAQPFEQEGGVGDRQLVPGVDRRRVAVGCMVALRKPAGPLVW
jgi:hypothetical protein